jgi:hypothetical protein
MGAAITALLDDVARGERIGRGARERVQDRFLNVRALLDYAAVVGELLPETLPSR